MVSDQCYARDWVMSDQPAESVRFEYHPDLHRLGWILVLASTIDVVTPSQVVSQTTTDDQPPYLRTYSVNRIARAFAFPVELLSQTTTEAN